MKFKPLLKPSKLPEAFSLYTLRRSFATLTTAGDAKKRRAQHTEGTHRMRISLASFMLMILTGRKKAV